MTECALRRKDFQSPSGYGGFPAIPTGNVKGRQRSDVLRAGLSGLEVGAGCEEGGSPAWWRLL